MQRHLRLKTQASFQRLRAEGRVWRHPLVMLSAAPNGLPHNRYGVVVSRRIGNAVQRNRVKRRLRACLGAHHEHIRPGYDLVWVARSGIRDSDYTTLCTTLSHLLRRAKLITD